MGLKEKEYLKGVGHGYADGYKTAKAETLDKVRELKERIWKELLSCKDTYDRFEDTQIEGQILGLEESLIIIDEVFGGKR